MRALLAFLAISVLLHQLSVQFEAFDAVAVKLEPSFEQRFARSRLKPVPQPQTIEQRDQELSLLDFIANRRSAYIENADRLDELARSTASARESADLQPVTAVILSWKRRRGLGIVLKHLATTPFLREIIVWNNNVDVYLDQEELQSDLGSDDEDLIMPTLRIVNAPSNLHDLAKHYACSMSSFEHCYFNDDDWLNPRIDSAYSKYLDDGAHRIVTNTMPYIAW